MLKKRIIPCLDIRNGRTVKGVNFIGLKDAGDPVELAKRYEEQGADELVFLDITATVEERNTFIPLVERISSEINIPFTVGGGIRCIDDVRTLLNAGADKVSVNSFAVKHPEVITTLSNQFGSQCIVVAIDTRVIDNMWMVYIDGGRTQTGIEVNNWALMAEKAGAGEILLTSMDHDGTKKGFAIELLNEICGKVNVPVIASGGAGKMEHFSELFEKTECTAALAAGIFHYGEIGIKELKQYLKTRNTEIR
jgi:imidazole glycerol-phosphate synthase subunit HisF